MNRIERIQESLRRESLDGWLFFDHHRVDKLAYSILGLPSGSMASRRWYALIPATGAPRMLVHRVEPHALDAIDGERLLYSRWTEQSDGLAKLLTGCTRIAMNYSPRCAIPYVSKIDAGTMELVRECGVEVVSSATLVQEFEAVWTDAQYESHLKAGRRVDRVRAEAFALAGERTRNRAPLTEFELQAFIESRFREDGLFFDHGPIVAVNANCSDPHYSPSRERSSAIQPGDFLLLDMFAKLDEPGSVFYDITWTARCGAEPSEEMQRVFAVVSGARDAGVRIVADAASSGRALRGFEVDDATRAVIDAAGYGDYFIHRTGHSIGEKIHGNGANMDNFETHDDRLIIPRTCFSVEPGVYLKDFGIRSEVNVYVGAGHAGVTGEVQTALAAI